MAMPRSPINAWFYLILAPKGSTDDWAELAQNLELSIQNPEPKIVTTIQFPLLFPATQLVAAPGYEHWHRLSPVV